MHGTGNDYIYLDCFQLPIPADPSSLAQRMSNRRFGVGGDGLILICPSGRADAKMRMFNADGSEAEMCGNGIRCVAKYLFERGICPRRELAIETGNGVLELRLEENAGRVEQICVDMGEPILDPAKIPTRLRGADGGPVVDVPLTVSARSLPATCVSMGNPHCVLFVDQADDDKVLGWGPQIERADLFPNATNVEFVEVQSPHEVRQRTWERGTGETWACGTGACAVCVAGVLTGRTARRLVVQLRGGRLDLHWDEADNHVYLTGPAEEVFTGEWQDG